MPNRTTLALAAAILFLAVAPATAEEPGAEEAVALYDAGKYAEAKVMLAELDRQGRADGPLLYRLAFALGNSGEPGPGKAMEARAVEVLEQEFETGGDLEVAFYLSNAYRNRKAPDRSLAVALAATDRQESGAWPAPQTALDRFRIGKLYADQGREDEASGWYRQALTGFEAQPGRYPSYEKWIRRYLYQVASERRDWETAGEMLQANLADGRGSRADMDHLAVLLSRAGRWNEAEAAWRALERLDPAQADRPRYCRQLTYRAREVGTLPVETLDGEPIPGLDKARMEVVLKELADRVAEIQVGAESNAGGDREADQAELDRIKGVFAAVALEYAYQGHPIRETAFQGGYAPMIFHGSRWVLRGS